MAAPSVAGGVWRRLPIWVARWSADSRASSVAMTTTLPARRSRTFQMRPVGRSRLGVNSRANRPACASKRQTTRSPPATTPAGCSASATDWRRPRCRHRGMITIPPLSGEPGQSSPLGAVLCRKLVPPLDWCQRWIGRSCADHDCGGTRTWRVLTEMHPLQASTGPAPRSPKPTPAKRWWS